MYALNSSASTVPTFTITHNELPNEEINSVSLTVSGGGGVNTDTTLELGMYNATTERIEREYFLICTLLSRKITLNFCYHYYTQLSNLTSVIIALQLSNLTLNFCYHYYTQLRHCSCGVRHRQLTVV